MEARLVRMTDRPMTPEQLSAPEPTPIGWVTEQLTRDRGWVIVNVGEKHHPRAQDYREYTSKPTPGAFRHTPLYEAMLRAAPAPAGPPLIDVVAAVRRRGDLYWLCRRSGDGAHGGLAGMWEYPGGKVEQGEQLREALTRELTEEFEGVAPVVGTVLDSITYGPYRVTFFEVAMNDPVALRKHTEARWMTPAETCCVDHLPSGTIFNARHLAPAGSACPVRREAEITLVAAKREGYDLPKLETALATPCPGHGSDLSPPECPRCGTGDRRLWCGAARPYPAETRGEVGRIGGCQQDFAAPWWLHAYRCGDCGHWFHKWCLEWHIKATGENLASAPVAGSDLSALVAQLREAARQYGAECCADGFADRERSPARTVAWARLDALLHQIEGKEAPHA